MPARKAKVTEKAVASPAIEETPAKPKKAKAKPAPAKAEAPAKAPKSESTPKKKAATRSPKIEPAPIPEPVQDAKPPEPKPAPLPRGRKPKAATPDAEPAAPAPAAETPVDAAPAPQPRPAPAPLQPLEALVTPFAHAILDAITRGQAVELVFKDANTYAPRTFEPRLVSFDTLSRAWYVWGWDRRYNAERHHCLDLLTEVNPAEGMGRAAQGPFKEGTPANQVGGWLGGEPIAVKAHLFKQWIYAVRQSPPPFPEFAVEDLEDGKAQVSFTGTDLRAIARWCMQFGDGIQVIEPQRLADRIKQVGAAWAGKPALAPAPKPEPPRQERHRQEHPKAESRPEPRPEPRPEQPRPEPKGKGPKVEIRMERL